MARACKPQLLGRLRQENSLNPQGGGCGELKSWHCTLAWATEQDSVSKKKKKSMKLRVGFFEKKKFIKRRLKLMKKEEISHQISQKCKE